MELDSEQREIVDYEGSCVVIAGPGSGKTRVLTAKAEKLWEGGVDLICLTFTRAAAQELRDRMVGIRAQTIHSFCYGEVGWPGNYEQLLYRFIGKDKVDKFEHVLVDEVQDLTEEELDVVLSIVGDKLFAVGDPFQAIYGWNGALGMKVFEKLNHHKIFHLRNNYRSCPKIVDWLNAVYDRKLVSSGLVENGMTAILCRTNYNVWEVSRILDENGIGYTARIGASELHGTKEEDYGSKKLKVMTSHCSKGLEFDNVLLYGWRPRNLFASNYKGAEDDEEIHLYYVSVARASKEFYEIDTSRELLVKLEGVLRGN